MTELRTISRLAAAFLVLHTLALAGCASTGTKSVEESNTSSMFSKTVAAADEAARRGNFQAALTLYAQALSEASTAEVWFKAGAAHSRLGNAREAVFAFSRSIDLDPLNADVHEQIGLLYVAQREIVPARSHLERAIAIDSKRWRSHNGLGVLADLEQNYEWAMVHFRAALEVQPNSPMLLNNIGYSRYLMGDLDGSVTEFTQALTLDSRYAPARRNLGLVYARWGSYDDAVQMLATVMDEPAAYNDVGYIALSSGDYAAAERLLVEAVERSPTYHETAAQNLALARKKHREQSRASAAVVLDPVRDPLTTRAASTVP